MTAGMPQTGMSRTGLGPSCRACARLGSKKFTIRFDTPVPVEVDGVMQLLDAQALQVWVVINICPRTCPSKNATLCIYRRPASSSSNL